MTLREVDETLIEESDEDASAERSNEAFSGNRVDSGQRDNGNFQGEVHRHDSNDSSLSESTRTLRSAQSPSTGQFSGGFDSTQLSSIANQRWKYRRLRNTCEVSMLWKV
jgi:hypothetical protein